jgi:hypothetical protein
VPVRTLRLPLLAAALLALAALLAPTGALAAKPRTHVEPAQAMGNFTVRGTHGWQFQVDGLATAGRGSGSVAVYASGPGRQQVAYQNLHASLAMDGTLDAALPGVGHIHVRFEETSREPVHIDHPKGCTGPSTGRIEHGIYRGSIELRGERGYTTVALRSARGELSTLPRQTCPLVKVKHLREREVEPEAAPGSEGGTGRIEDLLAERKWGSGTVTFQATSYPSPFAKEPSRQVEFTADYSHRRDGMWIDAQTKVEGTAEDFTVTAPGGAPGEATLKPPAPFKGSAEFTLESPTVAAWSGDLGAQIPTLGAVDLTAPAFGAMLCVGDDCTNTLPGVSISFGELQFIS